MAISQFLFHVLFVLGSITPSGTVAPHVHGAPLVLPVSVGGAETVIVDGAMWSGHLAAGIVTVLALHRGERLLLALHGLAAQAARWVQQRIDAVLVSSRVPTGQEVGALSDSSPLIDDHVLATLRGRAPPTLSAI